MVFRPCAVGRGLCSDSVDAVVFKDGILRRFPFLVRGCYRKEPVPDVIGFIDENRLAPQSEGDLPQFEAALVIEHKAFRMPRLSFPAVVRSPFGSVVGIVGPSQGMAGHRAVGKGCGLGDSERVLVVPCRQAVAVCQGNKVVVQVIVV